MSTRDRVILAVLFFGFVTFIFDVRYEHRYVVEDNWQGWIPVVYAGLAALGCLVGMAKQKVPRTIASIIFFLGIGVSGFGLYKHSNFDPKVFEQFLFPDKKIYFKNKDGEEEQVNIAAPLAAPLGFIGLSSIGFLVTSGLFKTSKNS